MFGSKTIIFCCLYQYLLTKHKRKFSSVSFYEAMNKKNKTIVLFNVNKEKFQRKVRKYNCLFVIVGEEKINI